MIKEEFIRSWETGQENTLAFEYGGYVYVPYIIAQAVSVTQAGREALNRLMNDSRWVTANLGNVDGTIALGVDR